MRPRYSSNLEVCICSGNIRYIFPVRTWGIIRNGVEGTSRLSINEFDDIEWSTGTFRLHRKRDFGANPSFLCLTSIHSLPFVTSCDPYRSFFLLRSAKPVYLRENAMFPNRIRASHGEKSKMEKRDCLLILDLVQLYLDVKLHCLATNRVTGVIWHVIFDD